MAAAVRALTGQLVRVRDGGRPKARSCHTKKYLRSLSQATNFERLGVEFWKAARPAAGACRSCILEGKAPNFGERRGLRFCIGRAGKMRRAAVISVIVGSAELGRRLEGSCLGVGRGERSRSS